MCLLACVLPSVKRRRLFPQQKKMSFVGKKVGGEMKIRYARKKKGENVIALEEKGKKKRRERGERDGDMGKWKGKEEEITAGHNVWHGRLQKKDGVEFTQFICSKGLNTSLKAKVFSCNVAFWEITYYSWSNLSNQGFFCFGGFFPCASFEM